MRQLRQFYLLIWKGFLMRKRHFIVTALEILIPLLLTFIFTYARAASSAPREHGLPEYPESNYQRQAVVNNATLYTPSDPSRFKWISDKKIVFAPNTTRSYRIINEMIREINETQYKGTLTPVGVETEDHLAAYIIKQNFDGTSDMSIGIVFNNFGNNDGNQLPTNLDYKLRMNGHFFTQSKFAMFQMDGPRQYDVYENSEFLAWQNAIDQSFIKLKLKDAGKTIKNEVKLKTQRFPYPSYISEDRQLEFLNFIPIVVIYGLSFIMPVFVKRILDEKANRAKELMRMMGLKDAVYFLGTLCHTYIILVIVGLIMILCFFVKWENNTAVIQYTDGSVFLVVLMLYLVNSLVFCMAISTFFNKAVLGAIFTFFLWISSYVVISLVLDPIGNNKYGELTLSTKLATSLLPNCAFHWSCRIMALYESDGENLNWYMVGTPGAVDDDLALSSVILMMIASILIYSFIFWYIGNIWPWQPGIAKSPLYPFQLAYWFPTKFGAHKLLDSPSILDEQTANKANFEEEIRTDLPGIRLSHLSKIFGIGSSRKLAVDNLSLSMYNGQITVLLGKNGAGKSTAMNLLTGLYKPSSGTAFINGYDIVLSTSIARSSLGLCPQHNVLYDDLTVEEHLKFFAGLKGMSFKEMPAEITSILTMLFLLPKRHTLASALSGGMKRKLSLGIALVANSKVLVLDEPTSGMDPQARRAVWDLLQKVRTERTILLTTHYMEEADALADKIAIVADGKLQCSGSPMFLKKRFGTGYHLRVSKGSDFDATRLMEILKEHVDKVELESQGPMENCYILIPNTDAEDPEKSSGLQFVALFDQLEENKSKLNYDSCGLSITTMEDVFLKVGELSETETVENEIAQDVETILTPSNNERIVGLNYSLKSSHALVEGSFALFAQRVRALLIKRFHDSRRYGIFFIYQIILPIVISSVMLVILQLLDRGPASEPPLKMNLNNIFGQTEAFYNGNYKSIEEIFTKVLKQNGANPLKSNNITIDALKIGETNMKVYKNSYLVGGDIEKSDDNVLHLTASYNGEPYHLQPISLNLMNTALYRYLTSDNNAYISITNYPLPSDGFDSYSDASSIIPISIVFAVFFPTALSFLSGSFVMFPIHERVTKSKLIQLMTGLNGSTFWFTSFIWDYGMVIIAAALFLLPFPFIKNDIYGGNDGILGVIFLMLLAYGWCAIPLAYLLSYLARKPSTGFIIASSINSVTGLMLTLAVSLYKFLSPFPKDAEDADKLAWFCRLFPDFAVSWGTKNIHMIGKHNSLCQNVDQIVLDTLCPELSKLSYPHRLQPCCPNDCGNNCFQRKSYITFEADSCGRDLLFMFLTGFLYFGLLIFLETNIRTKLWYRIKKWLIPIKNKLSSNKTTVSDGENYGHLLRTMGDSTDPDVEEERSNIESLIETNDVSTKSLVVCNITKSFGIGQQLLAVDHLTFSVNQNECFGLLGVNGAGKTSTFRMLTGDLLMDEGNAYIGHLNLRHNRSSFQRSLGYCPQFDALLDRLTGRESLTLFARLRGMPENEIAKSIEALIQMIDLQAHADKIAEKYSGGNRRKLSLALSLVAGPSMVLLDEPTAGVDPASRRKIWNTLSAVKKMGETSFILTTHSMEECESLCGRLSIMVNGAFRCMGSIQHLKAKYGQGFTLIIKMNKEMSTDSQAAIELDKKLKDSFNGLLLKDAHQGLFHYHLTDATVTWSRLFKTLESIKKDFNLEDYLVSDTTLEQIFLAFAKTQRSVAVPE